MTQPKYHELVSKIKTNINFKIAEDSAYIKLNNIVRSYLEERAKQLFQVINSYGANASPFLNKILGLEPTEEVKEDDEELERLLEAFCKNEDGWMPIHFKGFSEALKKWKNAPRPESEPKSCDAPKKVCTGWRDGKPIHPHGSTFYDGDECPCCHIKDKLYEPDVEEIEELCEKDFYISQPTEEHRAMRIFLRTINKIVRHINKRGLK